MSAAPSSEGAFSTSPFYSNDITGLLAAQVKPSVIRRLDRLIILCTVLYVQEYGAAKGKVYKMIIQ